MRIATLITHNDLELPCVILPIERPLFNGKEVLVYCQNCLVKGYLGEDPELVAELKIIVEFAMIPELEEFIKDNTKSTKIITEIYYV